MKAAVCTAMIVTMAMLSGCNSGDKKATELLETARFEEKQSNLEHAAELYGEILKRYPSSPAAQEAAARMSGLKQQRPR